MHKGEYNLRHVVPIVVAKGLKPEALKALNRIILGREFRGTLDTYGVVLNSLEECNSSAPLLTKCGLPGHGLLYYRREGSVNILYTMSHWWHVKSVKILTYATFISTRACSSLEPDHGSREFL